VSGASRLRFQNFLPGKKPRQGGRTRFLSVIGHAGNGEMREGVYLGEKAVVEDGAQKNMVVS